VVIINLSKSKYGDFLKCEKKLWLFNHRKEEYEDVVSNKISVKNGQEYGVLLRPIFGLFDLAEVLKEDNSVDYKESIIKTKELIAKGSNVIAEATFSVDNLFCMVDLLVKNGDKYDIYEIKSAKELTEAHINDVSFQRYVASKIINIGNVYVLTVNTNYVNPGKIDLKQLVVSNNLTNEAVLRTSLIENNIVNARALVEQENEPKTVYKKECKNCGFYNYCYPTNKDDNSIVNAKGMSSKNKKDFLDQGITHVHEPAEYDYLIKEIETIEMIDMDMTKDFFKDLKYPLYFLDFEYFSHPYPFIAQTKPNERLPFQYSLHIIDYKGAQPRHCEFLLESFKLPFDDIASSLLKDINPIGTIFVYNKGADVSIIKKIRDRFPEFQDRFQQMVDNSRDLYELFRKGYVHKLTRDNSLSLKSLLPAYFPNDPELNYKSNSISEGMLASNTWRSLEKVADKEEVIKSLKNYCKIDTLGLVKLFNHFNEVIYK
jgi:CRISPR/Cas system-associated exonuclease Cas4 (RecB family)